MVVAWTFIYRQLILNSRWHISTNANTSKIFWPQLFIGSKCSPMKTGFRAIQLGHPRPPWVGLGGPESQKWSIWGANKNKLSWIIFDMNGILDQKPKLLIMKSWSSEVVSDFWSGSFLVRQAKKPCFSTVVSQSGQMFLAGFKSPFTIMNLLIMTGANHKINLGR